MSRKDYELIAGVFLANITGAMEVGHDCSVDALSQVAAELAYELEADNSRFNRSRFLQACGIPQTV